MTRSFGPEWNLFRIREALPFLPRLDLSSIKSNMGSANVRALDLTAAENIITMICTLFGCLKALLGKTSSPGNPKWMVNQSVSAKLFKLRPALCLKKVASLKSIGLSLLESLIIFATASLFRGGMLPLSRQILVIPQTYLISALSVNLITVKFIWRILVGRSIKIMSIKANCLAMKAIVSIVY